MGLKLFFEYPVPFNADWLKSDQNGIEISPHPGSDDDVLRVKIRPKWD